MYWAMIFVMACGSSVTDDYTHNLSITQYYVLSYDICHGVWWFSNRRLYTQSQHYTVLCTELWYLSWRVMVQSQTIIHTIPALHGIMYWAMIFVMACCGSVTVDYTHNLSITRYYVLSCDICHGVWWFSNRRLYTQSQHYTVLCAELWYLSWCVVVQ